jgi:hypothetical protein
MSSWSSWNIEILSLLRILCCFALWGHIANLIPGTRYCQAFDWLVGLLEARGPRHKTVVRRDGQSIYWRELERAEEQARSKYVN